MTMTDKIIEDKMDKLAYEYCKLMEGSQEPKTPEERYWKEFHKRLISRQMCK